ncbi:sulfite exporter TauE/SafE family protein [Planktomarina temperata]|nr:sulfite exporter TauE/SafE family protein [Planktomarina temperata]
MDSVLGGMIAANLIVAVAAFLQASVGVGFAMIAVPLLLILDPELVPVPVLSAMTVLAAAMLIRERDAFDRKGVMALLPGLSVGVVFAMLFLPLLPANMDRLFGLLIVAAVVWSIWGPVVHMTRNTLFVAGTLAGAMGTVSGLHGPALAIAYQRYAPAQARATIAGVFIVASILSILALLLSAASDTRDLIAGLGLLPGTLIGFGATFILPRPAPKLARNAMLTVAFVSALALLAP